jgi:hypothetical protein
MAKLVMAMWPGLIPTEVSWMDNVQTCQYDHTQDKRGLGQE